MPVLLYLDNFILLLFYLSEKGTFSHCLNKFIVGGVAKNFLVEYFGGNVTVVLNNGRCPVAESKTLYYFNVSSYPSHCGTRKRVNWTHIELSNNLTVTTTQKQIITRQDLRIVLKCIFPRIYLRKALTPVDQDWISSHTVVEYNASQILEVSMSLYGDDSFMYNYTSPPALTPDDILFFEVALQSQNSFTSGLILDVVSCWATESPDPQDATKGIFLRDGCPIDMTFQWLLGNGVGPKSRFALQMFHMPLALPFYVHCLTRICSPDEDCTTECPAKLYSKVRRDLRNTPSAVVSAGPLFIGASTDAVKIQRKFNV
uniref:ZP domain-containing protein n=1 Tax=Denticeps clupeoides TaxID=299321 RepID=A0AAY4EZD8_9TELE